MNTGAPGGAPVFIYDAAMEYQQQGTPLVIVAGKEYGSGSSRDWAAKGPDLLGVRAAIAESYERIHRSNLLMCGIVPLQFMGGETLETLGLSGREEFSITGLENGEASEASPFSRPVIENSSRPVRPRVPRFSPSMNCNGTIPHMSRFERWIRS